MGAILVIIVTFYVVLISLLRGTVDDAKARFNAPSASSSAQPAEEDPPGIVDSKKLKKEERAFVKAVETATKQNMPTYQEKNVLVMGRTYCAITKAKFSKADILRLYGKNKERPEAEGVDLLALSGKILCPMK